MARFMNYVNGNIATEAYHGFVAAYREVAEKLRLGVIDPPPFRRVASSLHWL